MRLDKTAVIVILKNKRIRAFARLYRRQILTIFFLGVLSSSFFLIGPYFSKLFIDKAFINKDLAKFLNLSIWGAGVFVVSAFFKALSDIIRNKISIKLKLNLSDRFIRKFYSLDLKFFHSKSVGESVWRLADTGSVSQFFLDEIPSIMVDLLKLVVILGICLWMNMRMTLLLVVLSPLFLIHSLYIQNKVKSIYEQIWKNSALLSKEIYEAFSRILIIKAFGLEHFKRNNYLHTLIHNIRWNLKSFRWNIITSLTTSFLSKIVFGVISLYGGWLIIKGHMTIGSYTAVMIYLTQVGGLFSSFGSRFTYATQQVISLEKFFEVIDAAPEVRDSPKAKSIGLIGGEVRFEDVEFGYERDKIILKGVNLVIPKGSWVGVVGPSGCGKTTLINLIMRFYDPWGGRMLFDRADFKDIKIASLRKQISIATQEPLLFDAAIRDNISYGLRGVDQKKIVAAAEAACVHEYIMGLADGYSSLIGEDAYRLSQGLKQRVALARAILRNLPILILDEATSSVDSFTEEKIFNNLKKQRLGMTTIIISHRLFSVKDADRIFFLNKDAKLEDGPHRELLVKSSTYKEFFCNQIEDTGAAKPKEGRW